MIQYVKQFAVIMAVVFAAEGLRFLLPLPIPASVYGMILMFTVLKTGLVKLEQVRAAARFLTTALPVFLIPAAIGLMDAYDAFGNVVIPYIVIIAVATLFVMAVTGLVTQAVIRRGKRCRP